MRPHLLPAVQDGPPVNLRQLEVFVAVAEEESFSRAADRLNVVQSAVSATVRGLEAELGAELLERTSRGAHATDAGRALLPEARATLAAAQIAREAVVDASAGLRGTVRFGTMQSMREPAPNPAALIASFAQTHPGVEVLVRHGGGSAQMAAQVSDGRLDLAFVSLDRAPTGVELVTLSVQPMRLVCSADHPLAGRAHVELADLAEERFADLPPLWGTRIVNDRAFAAAGIARDIVYEINDTGTLLEFTRHGLAVTLLPESIVGYTPGIAAVPIGRHAPTFNVALALPTDRRLSAAVRALRDHITTASSAS
ncbi:MAG: LysR family transcriptional regulator [Solirubrobacteraceae bacterium]|nr:LysR family transcriptional regulator [Solirubrobacteraceae bacterium]